MCLEINFRDLAMAGTPSDLSMGSCVGDMHEALCPRVASEVDLGAERMDTRIQLKL